MSRARSRRGGVYLLVLGVSMVVVMIGVSASYLARIRAASRSLVEDSLHAELAARSAVDVVLKRLALDPLWRTGHTSGAWSAEEPIGKSSFRYMIEDADGDLADDAADDAELFVEAAAGGALRRLAVTLTREPESARPNLLTNGDFESGTTSWSGDLCSISIETGASPAGDNALLASGRLTSLSGPSQRVTSVIQNDTTYSVTAWVRVNASRRVRATIRGSLALVGFENNSEWVNITANTWTRFEATVTADWTGTLLGADFVFTTDAGIDDMRFDEIRLSEVRRMRIAHGSWRREVLP